MAEKIVNLTEAFKGKSVSETKVVADAIKEDIKAGKVALKATDKAKA